MLATLVDEDFDGEDWIFEIKWDGYRAIGSKVKDEVDLYSRNHISFVQKFSPVAEALKDLPFDAVLDGEVITLDDKGLPHFQYLQNWQTEQQGTLVYYVFDILWLNGYDLTDLPLIERKKILAEVIPDNDVIRYSDHVEANGKDFYKIAKDKGLEGIMGKNRNSTYEMDARTKNWLKIKTTLRQEVIVAGFTKPRSSRQYFGALILGVYEKDKLVYAGHTGSGFNDKLLKDVWNKLQPLITSTCPFDPVPKTNMPATWVKPKLICEIKFQEWTRDRTMRQPIFMGLRPDKKPREVKKEKAMPTKTAKKASVKKKASQAVTPAKEWLSEDEKEKTVTVNKHSLKLTNLDKIYWKKELYTKRDLLNYYHAIAPYMLPYMKNRPQSLNRHPNGINGMSFYQKNVEGKVPSWIKTFPDYSESNDETIQYYVTTDEASLIYAANLGCIEMNPWHSTTAKPDHPDYCLIDLDPHEINFDKVIEAAVAVKKVLDDLGIPGYAKTSGASGIHICIPLGAKYTYDQSRQLAQLIVTLVNHEIPSFTSLERSPSKRRRKVYLDYLQNSKGQTVACVYSVRPKPGATVSTPLYWEEVKKGLSPSQFTIENIFDRLKSEGDIFGDAYGKGIDIKKTLAKLESALT